MTANQIAYAKHREDRRHNLATEDFNDRDLAERGRHNVATENLTATDLAERRRHNMVGEGLTLRDLAEKQRHNQRQELIGVNEAQTRRIQANASKKQAEVSAGTLALNREYFTLEETKVSNDYEIAKKKLKQEKELTTMQEPRKWVDTIANVARAVGSFAGVSK